MEIHFDINLTKGQQEAYQLAHSKEVDKLVLVWSRQSGKSILAEILLIEYLFKKNTFNAYISPTFQLGRKVYSEICKVLEPTNIITKSNSSTLTIETIYGSTLQFFSAEAYTSIRGTTVSGILIIDEAAYIQDILPNGEDFWGNVVMPLTKARKPLTVLISTPCGKKGFFYDFYLRAVEGEKGLAYLVRTIYDDELISKEEIEDIRKSISSKAFAQEFECHFLDSSLTFFEGYENTFKDYKYQPTREWFGIDLSANGSDETIVTRVNENDQFKVEKIEGTLDEKYTKIANLINKNNPIAIYFEINGVGAPMYNEVKKLLRNKNRLYEWTTTNETKERIISNLAVAISNKDVVFNNEDKELFSQFGTFICKISKSKKLTFGAQDGKKDDMVMATAIAFECKRKFRNVNNNNSTIFPTGQSLWIR